MMSGDSWLLAASRRPVAEVGAAKCAADWSIEISEKALHRALIDPPSTPKAPNIQGDGGTN